MLEAGAKLCVGVGHQLSGDSYINDYSAHYVVPVPYWKARFYAIEC